MDSLEEFETKATFVSKLKADKGIGAIGKVSLQTAQVSLSSVQCNFRTYEINIFHRLIPLSGSESLINTSSHRVFWFQITLPIIRTVFSGKILKTLIKWLTSNQFSVPFFNSRDESLQLTANTVKTRMPWVAKGGDEGEETWGGYGNSVIFTARRGWVKLGVKLFSHQGNVSAGKPFFAHLTPQLIMHRTCSTASSPFVKVLRTLPLGCSYNFQCRAVSSSIFFMVGACTECAFPTQGANVGK